MLFFSFGKELTLCLLKHSVERRVVTLAERVLTTAAYKNYNSIVRNFRQWERVKGES